MVRAGEYILHSRTFEKIVSAECRNQVAAGTRALPGVREHAKLFAESSAELCARVFAVELRNETGADLGGTNCFALVSVCAIAKSLVIHRSYHS
jgi:hypothetical protein